MTALVAAVDKSPRAAIFHARHDQAVEGLRRHPGASPHPAFVLSWVYQHS